MRALLPVLVFMSITMAILISGCGKSPDPVSTTTTEPAVDPAPEYIVAQVNETPLTWEEMNRRAMGYLHDDVTVNHLIIPSNRMDEAKTHFRRRSINAFVFKTLMLDEALRLGVQVTEGDRRNGLRSLEKNLQARHWTTNDFFEQGPLPPAIMRREFEDGLIIDKMLLSVVRNKIKISDNEMADAITAIQATNQLIYARMEEIRKQIVAGADFAEMAKQVSECTSAKNGGSLGTFARGKISKVMEDVAFGQKVGEVSAIIQTRFGFHLIKTTERHEAKPATESTPAVPEMVSASHILLKPVPLNRKRLNDVLLKKKYNEGVDALFSSLKEKAKITCYLYPNMTF